MKARATVDRDPAYIYDEFNNGERRRGKMAAIVIASVASRIRLMALPIYTTARAQPVYPDHVNYEIIDSSESRLYARRIISHVSAGTR